MNELKKWRKLGTGSMHLTIAGKPRMIKPNEVFTATEAEIPSAFRDLVVLIEGEVSPAKETTETQKEEPKQVIPQRGIKPKFGIEKTNVEGFWNVVNLKTKKKVNAMPLPEDEAQQMIIDLEKQ